MSAEAIPPSAIFHRSLGKVYPTAVSGQGIYLKTKDGKLVIDGSSGAAVSCLGHGHPAVIEAIIQQAQRMAFAHTSFFTSNPAEELAELLLNQSAGAFNNVMFLSSGKGIVPST
jgi:adenosylmethionine-8-amino-7-oxononanoate aminotransferase